MEFTISEIVFVCFTPVVVVLAGMFVDYIRN